MENVLSLIGFMFPPAIDMLNRYVKSSDLRFWVSILFCIVVGAIATLFNGNFNPDGIALQAMIFIAQSQISYKFWGKTNERKELRLTGGSSVK